MKNVMRIKVLYFILGAVLFGSIGIVSAYTIFADSIGFKPENPEWEVENIQEAIDDLYSMANNNLYLYWQGNTYDDITGGWSSTININDWAPSYHTAITRKNAVFDSENGYIDLTNNGTYQYVVANTNNKIDCTDYNYITVWYNLTQDYKSLLNIEKTLSPIYYENAPDRISYKYLIKSNSYLVTYPISCSEAGYISFTTLRGVSSDTISDLKIYGVYLSKNL